MIILEFVINMARGRNGKLVRQNIRAAARGLFKGYEGEKARDLNTKIIKKNIKSISLHGVKTSHGALPGDGGIIN